MASFSPPVKIFAEPAIWRLCFLISLSVAEHGMLSSAAICGSDLRLWKKKSGAFHFFSLPVGVICFTLMYWGLWWCCDVADARAHCWACVGLWGLRLCDVKWVKQGCYWEQSRTPLGILFPQLQHNRLVLLMQHTVRTVPSVSFLCLAHMECAIFLLPKLHTG